LIVTDDDTKEEVVVDVTSGGKPWGDPIPKGKWEILAQERARDSSRPSVPGENRLDAVDSNPRNDVHEPTGRTNFRLHGPGNTIGCIACSDLKGWERIKALISRTKTTTVMDNATPWWKFWARPTSITKYGKLIVE
jgi:hypothetical protein